MREHLPLTEKHASGISKEHLVHYYATVSPVMLPYLKNRPQPAHRVAGKKKEDYLICNDAEALVNLAHHGYVEISPCSSTVSKPDYPDWVSIDLKPDNIEFKEVVKTALQTKKVLDRLDVKSYCKTSGSAGLQIFIPLSGNHRYRAVRKFAEYVAVQVNKKLPATTSLIKQPSKRKKKVYLDFQQNAPGATLVAPYSLNFDTTVSTPLEWKEVNAHLTPCKFTTETILKRLDKKGDLWKPLLRDGVNLHNVLYQLVMYL